MEGLGRLFVKYIYPCCCNVSVIKSVRKIPKNSGSTRRFV